MIQITRTEFAVGTANATLPKGTPAVRDLFARLLERELSYHYRRDGTRKEGAK